jgi:hypothetical protein
VSGGQDDQLHIYDVKVRGRGGGTGPAFRACNVFKACNVMIKGGGEASRSGLWGGIRGMTGPAAKAHNVATRGRRGIKQKQPLGGAHQCRVESKNGV